MSFTESLDKIVEENRNQLVGKHASWERVRLGDIATILNGFPFASQRFTTNPAKGQPLIRIRDVMRSATDTYYDGEFDPAYLNRNGDLLVGMDGDFNSAIWHGDPGLINQRVCKIALCNASFENRFLAYCLPGYLSAINAHTSSITVKHLSSRTIADIPLPLPPLTEQARIADTLDELFSDLDAGVAALERVRDKLKLYRASVLKAAVEGALTADWRARHPHAEPASELLQRILAERRRRWEEDQLRKFEEKGKAPPKNWKAKYKEPIAPKTADLPSLPEGWCWVTVDQLGQVKSGQTPKGMPTASDEAGSVVWFRVGDMNAPGNDLWMVNGGLRMSPELANSLGLKMLPAGSIIFPKRGGAIATNKKRRLEFPAGCDLNLMAVIPAQEIASYLWHWFQGLDLAKLSDGSNVPQINNPHIVPRAVPLPPLAEQEAIVEAVEDQLSVIEHLEADLDAKLKGAQGLRQAILRHAFTGKLVPQDPNDEPASELFKRIAAEREARAQEAAAAKRAARKTSGSGAGRRGRPRKRKEKVG